MPDTTQAAEHDDRVGAKDQAEKAAVTPTAAQIEGHSVARPEAAASVAQTAGADARKALSPEDSLKASGFQVSTDGDKTVLIRPAGSATDFEGTIAKAIDYAKATGTEVVLRFPKEDFSGHDKLDIPIASNTQQSQAEDIYFKAKQDAFNPRPSFGNETAPGSGLYDAPPSDKGATIADAQFKDGSGFRVSDQHFNGFTAYGDADNVRKISDQASVMAVRTFDGTTVEPKYTKDGAIAQLQITDLKGDKYTLTQTGDPAKNEWVDSRNPDKVNHLLVEAKVGGAPGQAKTAEIGIVNMDDVYKSKLYAPEARTEPSLVFSDYKSFFDNPWNHGMPNLSGAILPFPNKDGSHVSIMDPKYYGAAAANRRPDPARVSSTGDADVLDIKTTDGRVAVLKYDRAHQELDGKPIVNEVRVSEPDGSSYQLQRAGTTDSWRDSRTGEMRNLRVQQYVGSKADSTAEIGITDKDNPAKSEFFAPNGRTKAELVNQPMTVVTDKTLRLDDNLSVDAAVGQALQQAKASGSPVTFEYKGLAGTANPNATLGDAKRAYFNEMLLHKDAEESREAHLASPQGLAERQARVDALIKSLPEVLKDSATDPLKAAKVMAWVTEFGSENDDNRLSTTPEQRKELARHFEEAGWKADARLNDPAIQTNSDAFAQYAVGQAVAQLKEGAQLSTNMTYPMAEQFDRIVHDEASRSRGAVNPEFDVASATTPDRAPITTEQAEAAARKVAFDKMSGEERQAAADQMVGDLPATLKLRNTGNVVDWLGKFAAVTSAPDVKYDGAAIARDLKEAGYSSALRGLDVSKNPQALGSWVVANAIDKLEAGNPVPPAFAQLAAEFKDENATRERDAAAATAARDVVVESDRAAAKAEPTKVSVTMGDITQAEADVLITPVNSGGGWSGGVDRAIAAASGGSMDWDIGARDQFHDQARERLSELKEGKAVVANTTDAAAQKGKFGKVVFVPDDLDKPLSEIVKAGLIAADEAGAKSAILPAMRTGFMMGIVEKDKAEVAAQIQKGIDEFKATNPKNLKDVKAVIYGDQEMFQQLTAALAKSQGDAPSVASTNAGADTEASSTVEQAVAQAKQSKAYTDVYSRPDLSKLNYESANPEALENMLKLADTGHLLGFSQRGDYAILNHVNLVNKTLQDIADAAKNGGPPLTPELIKDVMEETYKPGHSGASFAFMRDLASGTAREDVGRAIYAAMQKRAPALQDVSFEEHIRDFNSAFSTKSVTGHVTDILQSVSASIDRVSADNFGARKVIEQLQIALGGDASTLTARLGQMSDLGITGPKVWAFYKDVAHEDPSAMLDLLKANFAGIVSDDVLRSAINNRGQGLDVPAIRQQVQEMYAPHKPADLSDLGVRTADAGETITGDDPQRIASEVYTAVGNPEALRAVAGRVEDPELRAAIERTAQMHLSPEEESRYRSYVIGGVSGGVALAIVLGAAYMLWKSSRSGGEITPDLDTHYGNKP